MLSLFRRQYHHVPNNKSIMQWTNNNNHKTIYVYNRVFGVALQPKRPSKRPLHHRRAETTTNWERTQWRSMHIVCDNWCMLCCSHHQQQNQFPPSTANTWERKPERKKKRQKKLVKRIFGVKVSVVFRQHIISGCIRFFHFFHFFFHFFFIADHHSTFLLCERRINEYEQLTHIHRKNKKKYDEWSAGFMAGFRRPSFFFAAAG